LVHGKSGLVLLHTVINFFSYFTILSNIFLALSFTTAWLSPTSRLGAFLARPVMKGGITLYIAITGTVYVLILRHTWEPQGWAFVADALLHYVMPVLGALDWVLFSPKGRMEWKHSVRWLTFPALYGVYTLLHGWLTGFYPYPFVDVPKLGAGKVLANSAVLALVFVAAGALLVAADRLVAGTMVAGTG
jgi:hypothetical protein